MDEELLNIFNGSGKYKGHDLFSLANNHSLDEGVKGIINTMEYLDKLGIGFCGTRKTYSDKSYYQKEIDGIKVGFVSCTYSLNEYEMGKDDYHINHVRLNNKDVDITTLKRQAKELYNNGCQYIILLAHYGNAYQNHPNLRTRKISKRIFEECGFNMIIGNHAHCIQSIERFKYICPLSGKDKKGTVAYSLGNFIADDILIQSRMSLFIKLKLYFDSKGELSHEVIQINPLYMWKRNRSYILLPLLKIPTLNEFKLFTNSDLLEYQVLCSTFKSIIGINDSR